MVLCVYVDFGLVLPEDFAMAILTMARNQIKLSPNKAISVITMRCCNHVGMVGCFSADEELDDGE